MKIHRLLAPGPTSRWLTCFFIFLLCGLLAQAQQLTISGKVVSSKEGLPLTGVSLQVAGSTGGTTTDADGNFKMSVRTGSKIVISFVGYVNQEVKVDKAALGVIRLQEDEKSLNSVVVVGYGTQKKVNLTGAISTLDMTEKEGQPIVNASNALHGLPGVFVNLGNSQPGVDRATIRIRGIGTLNNNDPLVLVDGVEYSMDELNPDDIASVSVLKDASAAIYGSRAANGVILVTTKSGKGRSHVNYNYYYGVQHPTFLPDVIWDPIAYMKLKDQAELNEGKLAVDYSDADIQEYQNGLKTDPYTYPSNNWFDIALDKGVVQKHNLSFSGSTDKSQYRLSLGMLNRDGIIFGPSDREQKYSIGLNSSLHVTKRLEIGLTLDGYYRNYSEPSYTNDSYWGYLMRTLPILTDTLKDGRFGNSWLRTPGRNNWENPRMIAYSGYYHHNVQRLLSTVFANYSLPFNINYKIKFGVDKYDGFDKEFIPQMTTINPKTGAVTNWNSPTTAPRSYNYDNNNLAIHFFNTLDWQHRFDRHNLSVMAGASYDNFDKSNFMAETTGYLDATLTALSAGPTRLGIDGSGTRDVLESYFGRLNYDYDGKYLLEATFRYDGSSRFAPGNRWGFFPSVSAGWRVDKESFFQWGDIFDLLKLRASVGQLGNQAVPLYSYENAINLGENYSWGGVLASGAASTAYSDRNITWETTTDYNAGLDMNLLKNRLIFTADVYKKRTTGILRAVNLPAQVGGLGGPQENIGTMDNTGYELTLSYRDNIGAFTYAINGNFSYNRNRVVDIAGQILYNYNTNLSTITKAGYPINSYYLLQADGIFQSNADASASAFQSVNTKAGYIKYKDINKDGIINGDDRVVVNTSTIIPKYTFGGGINLGYKGIGLNVFLQGVSGIKLYPTANLAFPFNNGAGATWEWNSDAWTPAHPQARLPIVTESTGSTDNFMPSTFWLRDGSYLRIKDIQLSYALPAKWLSKVKVSKFTVFLNAENWITFSKYKDFDPEAILNASTIYHYPMLKTFSGGLNVTF